MPVATISLFDTVTDSADAPVANATVTLTFGYNSGTTADGLLQPSIKTVQTDGTGKFTFAKVIPNDLISPANTVYMVETPFRVYEVAPQSGNGASQQSTAANVIVNNPLALAPYTLIGPVSVTGTLAVTGALTVVSNTGMQVDALGNISGRSLSLSSTGPYSPSATGVGGQTGRFAGAVLTGAPSTGTFAKGDFVVSQAGAIFVCTAAGTPGIWATAGFIGPDPYWDVTANGIIADGVTDQIVPLQALVDKLAATTSGSRRIWFPAKVAISTPLLLKTNAYAGIQFFGPGRTLAGLVQLTVNTPCVQTQAEDIHSVVFEDFGFEWALTVTSAHTNSYAISYNMTGGIGHGWYYWTLRRIRIGTPYVGLGIQGTGQNPVWGCIWDDVLFNGCKHRMIDLKSPTAVGMPGNVWRKITHLTGGGGDAPAIQLSSCEVSCDGLDLEDWPNPNLIYTEGGNPVVFRGIHIERWTTGGTGGNAFNVADGVGTFSEVNIVASTPDAGGGLNLFNAVNAGARLTAERITLNGVTIANVGTFKFINSAAATAQMWVRGVQRLGGTAFTAFPADATTNNALVQFDNSFPDGLAFGTGVTSNGPTNIVGPDPYNFQPGGVTAASVDSGPTLIATKDFKVGGHMISTAVGTPATTNLGANVTSATFAGNDTRGEVTIVMSAGLAANTRVCTVTFAVSYGATAPKIILVDQTSTAGLAIVNSYVLATSTGVSFDLAFDQALVAGTYKIDYIVIG